MIFLPNRLDALARACVVADNGPAYYVVMDETWRQHAAGRMATAIQQGMSLRRSPHELALAAYDALRADGLFVSDRPGYDG